ncbi:hypothetical protein BJ944DRAFT_270591 [Cunninghamella echinulata]|nr:hypothetical protein BJ944DRAFT_270591 [Cunninghamella echinulata]
MKLNTTQKETFDAILNTFLRELTPEETSILVKDLEKYPTLTKEQIEQVAKTSCKTFLPDFNVTDHALEYIDSVMPDKDKQDKISIVLSLLSSSYGMMLLSQGSFFKPFVQLSVQEKETFLQNWRQSRFQALQTLYRLFAMLTWSQTYQRPESDPYLLSPIGYPKMDPIRQLSDNKTENEQLYTPTSNKYNNQYPPRLPILSPNDDILNQEFDAIVIGSGPGGGVTAAKLAKAGQSVLVIEKGPYIHESEFYLSELGAKQTYERGTFFSSDDGSLGFVAGNLIGGGSSINYLATLPLPHYVREEWAKLGLSYFTSKKFTRDIEIASERIGASTEGVTHTGSGKILAEGCSNLGFHYEAIPQNTGGYQHDCHYCFAGCKDGIKNGSMNTWLRDCVEHGGYIIDQTKVTRVVIKNKKAVGVECFLKSEDGKPREKRIIHAKKVIVSGGSLQSPGILIRSGLKNKHIGQHLKVHPCINTFGFFNQVVDSHKAAMMTMYTDVVANRDGDHFGAKVESMASHAGLNAISFPWYGSLDHKKAMLKYRYCAALITVARNKTSTGYLVFDNKDGGESDVMEIQYKLSDHDKQSLNAGIVASAKIFVAAGAREIRTSHLKVPPFVFKEDEASEVNNPRFMKWLELAQSQEAPTPVTPHIMGTCRMGISSKDSVVKPTGETWEIDNLYVSDASVFPSCSGVNPALTIYSLSLHIADCILEKDTNKNASKL